MLGICIDGKQRLSSIREFVNGRIPCLDNRKRKWWYCETDGKQKRKILSDKQKDYFRNLEMLCVEYSELELTQEEELFSRVQMGMELRPAEKLRARSGLWQAFALEIENEYPDLMASQLTTIFAYFLFHSCASSGNIWRASVKAHADGCTQKSIINGPVPFRLFYRLLKLSSLMMIIQHTQQVLLLWPHFWRRPSF